MKEISISNSLRKIIVDDEDFERVNKHNWSNNNSNAVQTTIDNKTISVGHFILNIFDASLEIDHKNTDTFDNTRQNLRTCNRIQNTQNKHKILFRNGRQATSQYKGVYFHKKNKKFIARITTKYQKHLFLGSFSTEIEAAKVYNEAALKHFGEFARLNKL